MSADKHSSKNADSKVKSALELASTHFKFESINSGTFTNGKWLDAKGSNIESICPIDGSSLGKVSVTNKMLYEEVISSAVNQFQSWRMYPAPKRGEVIREIAGALREHKEQLSYLITLEVGKIFSEAVGEVQEAIDIADFAVGLSRQLYGLSMHSERAMHRMYEQWHPLGSIGVITAFNFPIAVWAWNAMIAAICGDVVIWKPSELTPLTSIAVTKICGEIATKHGFPGVFSLITGDGPSLGQYMADDVRLPLISATGSCEMGRSVGETVAKRLGRSLLELGGNNAVIVLKDANLELATRSIVFGAAGTAGQRCTTTRRVIVEESVKDTLVNKLVATYKNLPIGNPFDKSTLVGPLISKQALESFKKAIARVSNEGGRVLVGGKVLEHLLSGQYVEPTIVLGDRDMPLVKEETFAPIVFIIPVSDLDEAISVNNSVPQGLSSAIFTDSLQSAETFLSPAGSDCGIANVNLGTSGAEIGGAFGGEKDTGGGRESGSDCWKAYMRRQTNTINWGRDLPLAQGVKFGN